MKPYQSWGRYPAADHQQAIPLRWLPENLPLPENGASVLPYGLGRSYGDSCLNDGNVLLATPGLHRFIAFDAQTGRLRCEAGASLDAILKLIVPRGWFLPTTPGTKFITVGGAIANDVHGKNHHRAGTFGRHITQFELLRSDGSRRLCSPDSNPEWFAATIGGLGLTGLMTWAEFQLRRIESAFLDVESIKFGGLDEFFDLAGSDGDFEYTVAWVDCLASGVSLGRGAYMRGNHAKSSPAHGLVPHRDGKLAVPIDAPGFALNPLSVRAFNLAYYHKQRTKTARSVQHYDPFFYPLDSVAHWNRIYGSRGFFQYQCVVPFQGGQEAIRQLLARIAASGRASFLTVLKTFGELPSPGMLSFPRPGVTLAMDFPNQPGSLRFFEGLDEIVRDHGGRLYPAKDARMSAADFQSFYPRWREFSAFIDPRFSSSFWRRVTAGAAAPVSLHK